MVCPWPVLVPEPGKALEIPATDGSFFSSTGLRWSLGAAYHDLSGPEVMREKQ